MMLTIKQQNNSPIWISIEQRDKAQKIIKQKTLYTAGVGFIPIPILDAISITSIQLWMIRDIAKVYNIPFKQHVVKSFTGSLLGNTGTFGLLKIMPLIGIMLGGSTVSISAATSTYTLGQIFMQHFNQGGTLLDFNPTKSRAYFYQLYENMINKQLKQSSTDSSYSLQEHEQLLALQQMNQQFQEEEKIHDELHEEAEQYIIELHETVREQEETHLLDKERLSNHATALEKANENLQNTVDLLRQQLEETTRCKKLLNNL